eukprot:6459835-Amphidinium_carterae.2
MKKALATNELGIQDELSPIALCDQQKSARPMAAALATHGRDIPLELITIAKHDQEKSAKSMTR